MKKMIFLAILIIIILFLSYSFSQFNDNFWKGVSDPYGKNYDFEFVLKATGSNTEAFVSNLTKLLDSNLDPFSRGIFCLF